MKIPLVVMLLVATALPRFSYAQDESEPLRSVRVDEQIILSQVMTDKRAVYARTMQFTDDESRAFWPIYDEYEARIKKIDDRLVELVNDYAAKYLTMSDDDARQMLDSKMKLDRDRMNLQQAYTRRIARALSAVRALRYAQLETRIDNDLQRQVMQLIPLAP